MVTAMKTMRSVFLGLATAAVLVGCSSGGNAGSDAAVGYDSGGAEMARDGAAQEAGAPVDVADADRQVITTANATVEVKDPATAADDLAARVTDLGGWVDGRHAWAGDGTTNAPPSASLTLRVPSEELTGVIEGLDELGTVLEVSQTSDDVTRQVVDLDARIEALEVSTERLRGIMAEATDSADLLEAEKALSERQGELESLLSQRDHLADQVAMSTLSVELRSAAAPGQVDPGGFGGGLLAGWNALLSFVGSLLVVAGALLPWLVVIGVPVLVVLLVVRRRRRRRRAADVPVGPAREEAESS